MFLFLAALLPSFFVGSTAVKVYSIADLHGDYIAAIKSLQLAGLLGDDQRTWTGGQNVLVQTGDVVDRGDNSREIYELLFHLQDEAEKVGGKVIILLGNHEQIRLSGGGTHWHYKQYKGQRETNWKRSDIIDYDFTTTKTTVEDSVGAASDLGTVPADAGAAPAVSEEFLTSRATSRAVLDRLYDRMGLLTIRPQPLRDSKDDAGAATGEDVDPAMVEVEVASVLPAARGPKLPFVNFELTSECPRDFSCGYFNLDTGSGERGVLVGGTLVWWAIKKY